MWLFTALAAYQLNLPGLHADEAQEAGVQAQQLLAGRPVLAFRGAVVSVGGTRFPLMVQDYIGAVNVALALPFIALVGRTVFALRLMAVCVGLATVALTCALGRQLGGRRAGGLAALLVAVQPSFLFWSRQGVFVTSVTGALALGFLWALAAWLSRPERRARAAAAGLCAGLGIYAKLLFLWVAGGVVVAALILVAIRRLVPPRRPALNETPHAPGPQLRITSYAFLALTLALLLGLLPLALYNLQTGGTLASVSGNLTTSFYGVNNLDVARNLATRWDQLRAVLAGRDHLWYLGGSFGNPIMEWLLAGALAVIGWRAAARRRGAGLPLALALTAVFAFLQTVFTVSGLFPTHFAVLMPLAPVLVALGAEGALGELIGARASRTRAERAIDMFGGNASGRRAEQSNEILGGRALGTRAEQAKGMLGGGTRPTAQAEPASGAPLPREGAAVRVLAAGALVLALGGSALRDVWVDWQYHAALARTGGLNAHSDAVYALAEYLDREAQVVPVAALDWGIAPGVEFVTDGRIRPVEVFGYSAEADAEFESRLAGYLDDLDALYVLHWPQETIFPRREAFEAALAARGLRAVSLETFSRRDGAPIFEVMRAERP